MLPQNCKGVEWTELLFQHIQPHIGDDATYNPHPHQHWGWPISSTSSEAAYENLQQPCHRVPSCELIPHFPPPSVVFHFMLGAGSGLPLDFLPLTSEICPRFSSVTSMIDATELPSTATLLVDSWCTLPKEAIRGMSRLWPNLILRPVPRPRPRLKPKPGFKPRPKPKPRPRPRPKHRIRKRMKPVAVNFWERALILRLWENRLEPLWMRGLMIVDHRWAESGWSSCSAAIHNEVNQIQKHERGQTWRNYRHGNRVLFITARSQLSSYSECSTSQASSVLLPFWSLTKTKSADPLSFLDFYLASAFSNR